MSKSGRHALVSGGFPVCSRSIVNRLHPSIGGPLPCGVAPHPHLARGATPHPLPLLGGLEIPSLYFSRCNLHKTMTSLNYNPAQRTVFAQPFPQTPDIITTSNPWDMGLTYIPPLGETPG